MSDLGEMKSKRYSKYRPYRGIALDSTIQWKPKIYHDPFKFDIEKVRERIKVATEEGRIDDVDTIKRNIKRVVEDNPGMFDDFMELVDG